MINPAAKVEIAKLSKEYKDKLDVEKVVEKLKEIRTSVKRDEDPAIYKILRLCYEYIEENENFDIGYVEEEEIGDMTDFEYLMELILHSDRQINRDEITILRDKLWEELY